jgi:rSAM/selenodomain-associated transferase 1
LDARSTLLIVLAKAPQPGRVKTRLVGALGPAGAARLHARLLERTLATALAAGCGPVELHGTPVHSQLLRSIARRHGVPLRAQARGDVGARMQAAFAWGLRRYQRVILVGSDCPALASRDLRLASRWLQGSDAVIAPAEDGGYPLIGLRRTSPALFAGVPWSTAEVMAQTRLRLARLGWRLRELRTLWDVDRPEDLARLNESGLLSRHG